MRSSRFLEAKNNTRRPHVSTLLPLFPARTQIFVAFWVTACHCRTGFVSSFSPHIKYPTQRAQWTAQALSKQLCDARLLQCKRSKGKGPCTVHHHCATAAGDDPLPGEPSHHGAMPCSTASNALLSGLHPQLCAI